MISKIPFLLGMIIAVGGSFLQSPDQFRSTFNSTFLKENDTLFKPIVIPNVTKSLEQPTTSQNEVAVRKTLKPKEISTEEPKLTGNSPKFSSRYSTKSETLEGLSKERKDENLGEDVLKTEQSNVENTTGPVELPTGRNDVSSTEKHKSFADRSDDMEDGEEDTFKYDTNEPKEAEQSEITSTTNEPYRELQRPTSFRNTPYLDDDLENYETTSTTEETHRLEENEEEEGKRSVEDYYNSDSKYYHSIQTPLNHVKYLGAHSYRGSFEPETPRTRLVSPMSRQHVKPNWPYSRPKAKIEELNEISERDESHQKDLKEEVEEEVRVKPKPDLELAVEKDEIKFDRSKKYNYIDEKNRRNQQKKKLVAEEEKDDKIPLFQSLKQYQVDEEPRHKPSGKISNLKANEIWSTKPVSTTPKNTQKTTPEKKAKQSGIFNELTLQGPQFLGPVVFNQNTEQQSINPVAKPPARHYNTQKVPIRVLKGLLEKEKLDQDNLTNQRIEKSIFRTGSQKSFNHLEESNEMYNAILANIQSVFGIKTPAVKAGTGSRKGTGGSVPDVSIDESKSLTWSLPLIKRTKVN